MIVMDDSAEYISAFHRAFFPDEMYWHWTLLLDALMRARLVVVANVFPHHSAQMEASELRVRSTYKDAQTVSAKAQPKLAGIVRLTLATSAEHQTAAGTYVVVPPKAQLPLP